MKVLIVDDDEIVRLSLQRAFEFFSHQVFLAPSGEEGLQLWKEVKPDAVLLDALMPGMTGFEVLEQVQENNSMIIMISAFTGASEKDIQSSKAHYFIAKPFEDILQTVKHIESLYANHSR